MTCLHRKFFLSFFVSFLTLSHSLQLFLDSLFLRQSHPVCLLNGLVVELRKSRKEVIVIRQIGFVFLVLLGFDPLVWLVEDLVISHEQAHEKKEPLSVWIFLLDKRKCSPACKKVRMHLFSVGFLGHEVTVKFVDKKLLGRPAEACRDVATDFFLRHIEVSLPSFDHELHGAYSRVQFRHHVSRFPHSQVIMLARTNHFRGFLSRDWIRVVRFYHIQI